MEEKLPVPRFEPPKPVFQPALPGFYDLVYEPGELEDFNNNPYGDLISEIALLRINIRRALRKADEAKNLDDSIRVLNAVGLAVARLARLLEVQQKLAQGSGHINHAIELSIKKYGEEMGINDAD